MIRALKRRRLIKSVLNNEPFDGHTIRFEPGLEDQTLWIVFSHVDTPPGKYSQSRVFSFLEGNRVFLNPGQNDWYLNGLPGFANSFEQMISTLKKIISACPHKDVVLVGHSMGAYAALRASQHALDCRFVVTSPELVLGLTGSRSLKNGVSDRQNLLARLAPRDDERGRDSVTIFGQWDPVDAYYLSRPETYDGRMGRVYTVPFHHGVTEYLTSNRYYLSALLNGVKYLDALEKLGGVFAPPDEEERGKFLDFWRLHVAMLTDDKLTANQVVEQNTVWNNPGWHALLSKWHLTSSNSQLALEHAERALELSPSMPEFLIGLAETAAVADARDSFDETVRKMRKLQKPHRSIEKFLSEAEEL